MASRTHRLSAFDGVVARLESTANLAELESEFLTCMQSYPFQGAAFAWWAYPPPVRAPDFQIVSGTVDISEATIVDPGGELWSKSLPVIDAPGAGTEGDMVNLRVALLGPRRRFGVLTANLMIENADLPDSNNDWRGRFLLLAHVVQHRVGMWNPKGSPNLGRREVQCLKLAAEGLKAKQIAVTLGIGQQTVQFHLSRAREKLNCANTVQAVARAVQFGLLPDMAPSPVKDLAGNSETVA
ncbi:MAG: helix-turn-helix transcriptional regulator [Beijerinckiaceae bacterium]|nr:helix-turn-helix transcriptional regulator [Beijerinckiaceae bacterium]